LLKALNWVNKLIVLFIFCTLFSLFINILDVILTLLWFASPSDKRPNDSFQMMLQRRRYMPYGYLADEAMDQLTEKDLDLILVSVSGLEDSTVEEHKANAMKFYQRAKLRVKQKDPYYPNAHGR
jgi:hypothetical protein